MSVTGYKPNDPTKITYKVMSDWTASVITDRDDESQYGDAYYETASGSYALCEKGYTCNGKTRTACSGLTYSDTYGASECKACPTPTAYASSIDTARDPNPWYYTSQSNPLHDKESACYAQFKYADVGNVQSATIGCQAYNGDYGNAPAGNKKVGKYETTRCSANIVCKEGYHYNVELYSATGASMNYEASLLCDGNSDFSVNSRKNDVGWLPNINIALNNTCVADSDQTFVSARKYIADGLNLASETAIQNWCETNGKTYTAPADAYKYENL